MSTVTNSDNLNLNDVTSTTTTTTPTIHRASDSNLDSEIALYQAKLFSQLNEGEHAAIFRQNPDLADHFRNLGLEAPDRRTTPTNSQFEQIMAEAHQIVCLNRTRNLQTFNANFRVLERGSADQMFDHLVSLVAGTAASGGLVSQYQYAVGRQILLLKKQTKAEQPHLKVDEITASILSGLRRYVDWSLSYVNSMGSAIKMQTEFPALRISGLKHTFLLKNKVRVETYIKRTPENIAFWSTPLVAPVHMDLDNNA